jgi:hypothetical protein
MTKTYSQVKQDLFVLEKTNFKKNGTFVDIAAGHPMDINNTFLLENEYEWNGISVEIDSRWNQLWNKRKCKYLNCDAFSLDYDKLFNELAETNKIKDNTFDYLSLDLEPTELTDKLLHILPLNKFKFKVITYEHDAYRYGFFYKNRAMDYLKSLGYSLCKENIINIGNDPFEDWYTL